MANVVRQSLLDVIPVTEKDRNKITLYAVAKTENTKKLQKAGTRHPPKSKHSGGHGCD